MSFNLGAAITTGIQAFTKTGNPWVAVSAAAACGFAGGNAQGAPPAATPGALFGGSDSIGKPGNLGSLFGGHDGLKARADRKPLDFSGLLSGEETKAPA